MQAWLKGGIPETASPENKKFSKICLRKILKYLSLTRREALAREPDFGTSGPNQKT